MAGGENSKFIPELIIEFLRQNGVDFITTLPEQQYATISDVVNYCKNESAIHGKMNFDFDKLIKDAVSLGYDKRYFGDDLSSDERCAYENNFENSFKVILNRLDIGDVYDKLKVIVVGIGNGEEGRLIYSHMKNLTIVDIAPVSLSRAKSLLSHAAAFKKEANKLDGLANCSFDLYISLRTYQSTYFDILGALQESKRVLKEKGAIIISVASGYKNGKNEFQLGLYNPHSGKIEKDRPTSYINNIKHHLINLGFDILGTEAILSEVFIYAIKRQEGSA